MAYGENSLTQHWKIRWEALVNRPMTEDEAERFQISMARNRPYGDETWQDRQAKRLGLEYTLRREGRPRTVKTTN